MVGIVIPTKNRSEFLIRQLEFYASQNYHSTIYIADSSDEFHLGKTLKSIDQLKSRLKIIHIHVPKMNIERAKKEILAKVKEKYASYCGDDDFLIPQTLFKCAEFLDSNLEYSNCHGVGALFSIKENKCYGEIVSLGRYRLLQNEHNNPARRLIDYLTNYWPMWSVRRTEEFQKDLRDIDKISMEPFRELFMGCQAVICGQSKLLKNLYVVRQIHPARWKNPTLFKQIIDPTWQPNYLVFQQLLTSTLVSESNLDENESLEIVQQAYWSYLTNAIITHGFNKKDRLFGEQLKGWIKSIPSARLTVKMVRTLRSYISSRTGELSLPALLRSSSPYHKDFIPLYLFITSLAKK